MTTMAEEPEDDGVSESSAQETNPGLEALREELGRPLDPAPDGDGQPASTGFVAGDPTTWRSVRRPLYNMPVGVRRTLYPSYDPGRRISSMFDNLAVTSVIPSSAWRVPVPRITAPMPAISPAFERMADLTASQTRRTVLDMLSVLPKQPAVSAWLGSTTKSIDLSPSLLMTQSLVAPFLRSIDLSPSRTFIDGVAAVLDAQARPLAMDMSTVIAPMLTTLSAAVEAMDLQAGVGLHRLTASLHTEINPLLRGAIEALQNVPLDTWDDIDEFDVATAVTDDLDNALTAPDPQTLQRVLHDEQQGDYVSAHLHLWTSLDETLSALGFDAGMRARLAPVLATTAGALAFVLSLVEHYTGGHVRALRDAGSLAAKTYNSTEKWAKGD